MGTKKNNHTDPICFCCFESDFRWYFQWTFLKIKTLDNKKTLKNVKNVPWIKRKNVFTSMVYRQTKFVRKPSLGSGKFLGLTASPPHHKLHRDYLIGMAQQSCPLASALLFGPELPQRDVWSLHAHPRSQL